MQIRRSEILPALLFLFVILLILSAPFGGNVAERAPAATTTSPLLLEMAQR